MYFTKKRYVFEAFDGKSILSVQLDYPADGDGLRYEYLSKLVDKCSNFVSEKLYDAVIVNNQSLNSKNKISRQSDRVKK